MLANRFVAVIDACSLVSALGRNTLLSLADGELYRVRWSSEILDETEGALSELFAQRGFTNADERAKQQRERMVRAFPEAAIDDYQAHLSIRDQLPDPKDAHVVAAGIASDASVIVTENLKDFPETVLGPLAIESKSTDDFIADTIDLYPNRAVNALATMRQRFNNPALTADQLLLKYESEGFIQTADVLKPYVASL